MRFQRTRCRVLLEARGDVLWHRGGMFEAQDGAIPRGALRGLELGPKNHVTLVHEGGQVPLFTCNELDAGPALARASAAFRKLAATPRA